jgi:hypothetical protein
VRPPRTKKALLLSDLADECSPKRGIYERFLT